MPMDAAQGMSQATALLQGTGDEQLKNKQLDQEKITSGLNYIKDASGKAIDFMTQVNQEKGLGIRKQLELEAEAERQKVQIAAKATDESRKAELEKSKHDYENFMTMTPELAQGIFASTKGRLDFRRATGERILTKVLIPMIQVAGHRAIAEDKPNPRGERDRQRALKTFTSEYDKRKKAFEDPLQASMASRDQKLAARRGEDEKWLQQNKNKYNQAMKKTAEAGGLDDDEESTSTPPSTSSSDIDALIDAAYQ